MNLFYMRYLSASPSGVFGATTGSSPIDCARTEQYATYLHTIPSLPRIASPKPPGNYTNGT